MLERYRTLESQVDQEAGLYRLRGKQLAARRPVSLQAGRRIRKGGNIGWIGKAIDPAERIVPQDHRIGDVQRERAT